METKALNLPPSLELIGSTQLGGERTPVPETSGQDHFSPESIYSARLFIIGLQNATAWLLCGKHKIKIECSGCGKEAYASMTCHNRFCEKSCAETRKKRYYENNVDLVDRMNHPRLMTLTIRNTKVLTVDDYVFLLSSFSKLRRRKELHYVDPKNPKNNVEKMYYGYRGFETKNVGRGWNHHLHVYYDGQYIDQKVLSAVWKDVTGGRGSVVDIRDKSGRRLPPEQRQSHRRKVLHEMLGYMGKVPTTQNPIQMAQLEKMLQRKRVLQPFGTSIFIKKCCGKRVKGKKTHSGTDYVCDVCGKSVDFKKKWHRGCSGCGDDEPYWLYRGLVYDAETDPSLVESEITSHVLLYKGVIFMEKTELCGG